MKLKARVNKLEQATPQGADKYRLMTDDELRHQSNVLLWELIFPLLANYGIDEVPIEFPGAEAAEGLLGDSLADILDEFEESIAMLSETQNRHLAKVKFHAIKPPNPSDHRSRRANTQMRHEVRQRHQAPT